MSKEEFIASRSSRSEKVSTNTEGEKSITLIWTDTPLFKLLTKSTKKTAPITVHTVIDRHKVEITTHRPAPTLIVSLNTEREKISTFHTKQI